KWRAILKYERLATTCSTMTMAKGASTSWAESGNPVGLHDTESKQHCGVAYDDFDLSTLGIRPGTKCDFVKLSQTSNGEIVMGSPPESVMHASGDPSKREV